MSWRIGLIGLGKIAQDKHLPALAANPAFELAAVVDPHAPALAGVPGFTDHRAMLDALPDLDAVAICTPPGPRHSIARDCLLAGKQVLLEKPPTATLSELVDLERLAAARGRVLYATWHSRHAPAIEEARRRLAGQGVRRLRITWKEDVRRWHPGQQWIWQPGGFGVFDPGINALSIATRIMPTPLFVRRAELHFPANRDTPIAADLDLGEGFEAVFDWRQTGDQIWEIEADTDAFRLKLAKGGGRLEVDGEPIIDAPRDEYAAIYRRFDELLRSGASDVDADPLRLVADAFMIGRRIPVERFED
ncbi:MAG: Gfo/Idh/MocA family oxidoreductase [Sphingomonadaceae bacterium]|nr:Gfo/Idh/MocA family oxidoreductase [Sphingomonadaceae bacterium]